MKKKLSLGLALSLLICSVGFSACGGKEDVPVFAETEGVRFTAYSGPTVENWSGSQKNISTLTDEHFQKFVDAGFNKLIAIHEGAPFTRDKDPYEQIKKHSKRAEEDALEVLALAEKYNVKYYVRDWSFYNMNNETYWQAMDSYEDYERVISEMFGENNPYIHSPSYAGNFGRDEPGADQFERIGWQIDLYNKYMKERGVEGAEMLVNLLPAYGSTISYGGERGEPISYTEYIDRYFEQLAPKLGYVSFDYYPFMRDNRTGSLLKTSYVSNLELLANKCKQTGYELRTFVQTGGDFTGLRDLTSIGDFRLQVYMNLAFGAREMTYYEYGTFNDQVDGDFGLIDLQDGSYNYTYDLAKRVNNEVHAFEDAYLHYNYDGVMCFTATEKADDIVNVHFRGVANQLESHPRLKKVVNSEDIVLTSFKDADNKDAFMLVNYTDPMYNLSNEVTITFNDASRLLMYRFGEPIVVSLNSKGAYTFKLYPGEGRFIIPLK
jgi:hypothetical protein